MLRISIITCAILSSFMLLAQEQAPRGELQKQNKGGFVIKVDAELVQVPVSVLDKDGRPVSGLSKEHFQVFENKVQQQIERFNREDVPISLGLVIDNSGSMRNKRQRVNSAALAFVRESNPDDETFIVNFDDAAYLEQEFTGSIGDLMDALDNLDTRGETALYDAIYLSLEHVNTEGKKDKKALLVVSDGEDNTSKYKYEDVLKKLKESSVSVYAIGLLEENDQRGGLFKASPSKRAREALQNFANATGGVAYFPKSIDQVEDLCRQIAHDLRNHYTIGYVPTNMNLDGTWREIRVVVNPPKSMAAKLAPPRHKQGYFALPPQPTNIKPQ